MAAIQRQLVVGPPRAAAPGGAAVRAPLRGPAGKAAITYRLLTGGGGPGLALRAEPFLIPSLLPAMAAGARLRSEGPVSRRLLGNLDRIQEIFRAWDPAYRVVGVEAPPAVAPPRPGRGRAVFFSAGVDSFYTVLKHRRGIDHLIFVHGFDVPLGDRRLREVVLAGVRPAAAALGLPLLEVETDVRAYSDRAASWKLGYGPAMAATALALSTHCRRFYIAASNSYAHLHPNGSHPLLDPLWSTEDAELVHDGCEATREEKIRRLASEPVALEHLRVCWENRGGAYNCGECEKCLRTMAALRAVGALERCPTFRRPLDLGALSRLPLAGWRAPRRLRQLLEFVAGCGGDPELEGALRRCLARAPHHAPALFPRLGPQGPA